MKNLIRYSLLLILTPLVVSFFIQSQDVAYGDEEGSKGAWKIIDERNGAFRALITKCQGVSEDTRIKVNSPGGGGFDVSCEYIAKLLITGDHFMLGCNDNIIYSKNVQKKWGDNVDTTAEQNMEKRQYINATALAGCFKQAGSTIKQIQTECGGKNIEKNSGDNVGTLWRQCEDRQNRLMEAVGFSYCSNLYTPSSDGKTYTLNTSRLGGCRDRINQIIDNTVIQGAPNPPDGKANTAKIGRDGKVTTYDSEGDEIRTVDADPPASTSSGSGGITDDDTDSNCAGGSMGWLFCPMIEYMANTLNAVAGVIDQLMEVRFMTAEGPVAQIEKAWRAFLSFANIFLVVVFLIIIFSQATQAGLSNYNIKRMLPRLVAGAILMNVSFYLCAFLVDMSNIFGGGVMGLFIGNGNSIAASVGTIVNSGGGGLLGTAAAVVGGAALIIGTVMFILPFVLLSIISVFIMLIGRQVVLMCLIILSSLAFVAWLLPNTEQYFQKWWKLFTQLLIVYPMIMIVFGASLYLSTLIGSEDGIGVAPGESNVLRRLIQLVVLMIPLFALPGLLKGSSAIMGRISSAADNVSRQVGVEKLGTGLQGRARDYSRFGGKAITKPIGEGSRRLGRGARNSGWGTTVFGAGDNPNMLGRGARAARNAASPSTWKAADKAVQMAAQADRDAKKQAIDEKAIGMINASGNRTIGGNLARVGGTQLVAAAGIQAEEAEKKRVQGIYATMRLNGSDINALSSALSNAIASGDHSTAAASIQRLRDMGAGGVMSIGNTLTSVGQVDRAMQSTIENTLNEGSNYSAIVARDAATAKGGFVNGSFAKSAAGLGEISAEQMATQTSASLGEHAATASAEQAREVMNNPTLRKSIVNDDAAYILTQIATGNAHAVNVNTTAPQGWQRPNNI